MRKEIENFWLRAVRFYTFNTPLRKGRHRAYLTALKFCRNQPEPFVTAIKDGRRFNIDFSTGMHETVFFLGEYESAVTEIVKSLLDKNDVCLDIGANFGWYTTLFAVNCAEVHSFEPTPPSFEQLKKNFELLGSPKDVFINNLALGDTDGELTINLFPNEPFGHASLSDQGRTDAIAFQCRITTLDSYLESYVKKDVNFVKIDIEGAELMFFKGAEKLFRQSVPPIFLIEMALAQTANFGYLPNDLIEFMRARANYDFYRIDELNTKLIKFEKFPPQDIGANVICFPRGFYAEREKILKKNITSQQESKISSSSGKDRS